MKNLTQIPMRYLALLFLICFSTQLTLAQTKKELTQENSSLKASLLEMKTENESLKKQLDELKVQLDSEKEIANSLRTENDNLKTATSDYDKTSKSTTVNKGSGKCQAKTQEGNQCSRSASEGSKYCYQHKTTYEPNGNTSSSTKTTKSSGSSSSSSGKTIHTGPRGGRYYINSNGKKVYVK